MKPIAAPTRRNVLCAGVLYTGAVARARPEPTAMSKPSFFADLTRRNVRCAAVLHAGAVRGSSRRPGGRTQAA